MTFEKSISFRLVAGGGMGWVVLRALLCSKSLCERCSQACRKTVIIIKNKMGGGNYGPLPLSSAMLSPFRCFLTLKMK